jgi:CBS domain-containing protein
MNISDVMTPDVKLVNPDTGLPEIARRMRDEDVGAMPVADQDRLVGMITDRDIVVRALADGRDPSKLTARDVMTDAVLYCYQDQSTKEVLDNMSDIHKRRLPVVDRDKKLVGIVSLGDLAADGPGKRAGEALKDIASSPPDSP